MRTVDRRWPYLAACLVLFALAMGGLRYLQRGFTEDFGVGLSLGVVLGLVIAFTAVGWRRGELR